MNADKTTPVLTLFRTVVSVRGRNLLRLQRKVSPTALWVMWFERPVVNPTPWSFENVNAQRFPGLIAKGTK